MIHPLKRLVVAVLVSLSAPAFGDTIPSAFLRTLTDAGFMNATVANTLTRDGTVILQEVSAKRARDGAPLNIGRVAITGGALTGQNALTAERVRYSGLRLGNVLSWESALLTNARWTAGEGASPMPRFTQLSVTALTAQSEAGKALSLSTFAFSRQSARGAAAFSGELVDLRLSGAVLGENARRALAPLGLLPLTVSLSGNARYDPLTEAASVEGFTLTLARAGSLSLSFAAAGVNGEALASLAAQSATIMERLAALSPVALNDVTLTLTDGGLTGRLLDRAAAQTGLGTDAIIERLMAAIPSQQAMPLHAALRTELAAFLKSPGTLTLKASPNRPVRLGQLLAMIVLDPAKIPAILDIDVAADEPEARP